MNNNNNNNSSEELFLTKYTYLWHKKCVPELISTLKNFNLISQNRALTELILEIEFANNNFLRNIRELPIIMNCRTKTSQNANFGGILCANFMNNIIKSCDKFLNTSINKSSSTIFKSGSVEDLVNKIKLKAKQNSTFAREFESQTKETYRNSGTDKSTEIFKNSGYNI